MYLIYSERASKLTREKITDYNGGDNMDIALGLCIALCILMFIDDRLSERHQERMEMLKKGGKKQN